MIKNQRRKALLQRAAFGELDGLPVNNKWQLRSDKDPDLARLVKQGYLRMERTGPCGRAGRKKRSGKRQSYLVPTLKGFYAAAQ